MVPKSSLSTFPIKTEYVFYNTDKLLAALSQYPTAPGQTQVVFKGVNPDLFLLDKSDFVTLLLQVRHAANIIQSYFKVRRCALVTEGDESIAIIPLHGLKESWEPVMYNEKVFEVVYPGYISSKDGPQMELVQLDQLRSQIQTISGLSTPFDQTFKGDAADQNLFARLIRCELPQHRIWEDDEHVAFLTPFANTPGFTVLVPRSHLSSDIFSLTEESYAELVAAAHTVGNILRESFKVSRCGMIFEGFEIDYAHVKLIPIHIPSDQGSEPVGTGLAQGAEYQEKYKGFVTSMKGPLTKESGALLRHASNLRHLMQEVDFKTV